MFYRAANTPIPQPVGGIGLIGKSLKYEGLRQVNKGSYLRFNPRRKLNAFKRLRLCKGVGTSKDRVGRKTRGKAEGYWGTPTLIRKSGTHTVNDLGILIEYISIR